jgi:hypothetical protein
MNREKDITTAFRSLSGDGNRWQVIRAAAALLFSLLLISCAGQVSPSGGPPDKTPPRIIATSPLPGTLNFHDNKLSVQFDKYIRSTKVQDAIFISPHINHLSYDWSYKGVEIHFSDTLRPATTYILIIGTDAEDSHGNKLAHSFALPFSTGDKIDSASLSGKVFDQNPAGVMLFAYRLDGRLADTLNPTRSKPDFLTQAGPDGTFSLLNLPPGDYRLFAVFDEYKNLLYDIQTDRYGVLPGDLFLPNESSSIKNIQYMLTTTDTSAPFLSSVKAINQRRLQFRFNKPIDPATVPLSAVTIKDTVRNTALTLFDISFTESSTDAYVVTSPLDSPAVYRVGLVGARDRSGNRLSLAASSLLADGILRPDTLKPAVKFLTGADSIKNVDPGDTILLTISKQVLERPFERGFSLLDSTNKVIPASLMWFSSMRAMVVTPTALNYGEWYTVKMRIDSLIDFGPARYHDSTLVRHFQTVSEEALGSIEGTISDELSTGKGRLILVLHDVAVRQGKSRAIPLDSAGAFTIDHVKEGKYGLWAYRDADGNGVYSYGKPFPFVPAERFTVYPETLKVRARWPLAGVQLRLTR